MTFRLIQIDDALRGEHFYLSAEDQCYCLGEYQPRAGYSAGPVNSMISNFKKSVAKRGLPEYRHKQNDINRAGQLVRNVLSKEAPGSCTFVPVPPSKAKDDPLYDDRLLQVLTAGQPPLDVRELLVMRASTRAHHEYAEGAKRPTPDELYALLRVDESSLNTPIKQTIILFDDLLTTGTHFKACKRLISERLPGCNVVGMFIGRRKLPPQIAPELLSMVGI
ncbi:hypothetical protein [Variovorax saccharolyticus]|uniref:hypothetical protein n=1 Tax=Variovorax saccharolyticus TaxID=3053516 RepID=UPI00257800FD|nr:hypothetical protein [Variovorax sp. J31P216]MDM0030487.1 hypothetical protein [Variovorax sp. J31P216]